KLVWLRGDLQICQSTLSEHSFCARQPTHKQSPKLLEPLNRIAKVLCRVRVDGLCANEYGYIFFVCVYGAIRLPDAGKVTGKRRVTHIEVLQYLRRDVPAEADDRTGIASSERDEIDVVAFPSGTGIDNTSHTVWIAERECIGIDWRRSQFAEFEIDNPKQPDALIECKDIDTLTLVFLLAVFTIRRQSSGCHHCSGVEGPFS